MALDPSAQSRQRRIYRDRLASALMELEEMKARYLSGEGLGACVLCGHIAYPVVVKQGCWCDPSEYDAEYDADAAREDPPEHSDPEHSNLPSQ